MSVFERLEKGKATQSSGGIFSRLQEQEEQRKQEFGRELRNIAPPIHSGGIMGATQRVFPNIDVSAIQDGLKQEAEQQRLQQEKLDARNPVQKGLAYVFQENPVARMLNYPFAKAAEYSIPDAPMLDGSGRTAREEHARLNPVASTGSDTLDKVGDVVGQIGSYLLNPAAPAQGPLALYKAAENLGATRLMNQATKGIKSPLGQKVAQEAAREGVTAAAYGLPHSLIQGDTTAPEIARNVAIEGALGAAAGGAVGAIAPLAKKGVQAITNKLDAKFNLDDVLSPPKIMDDASYKPPSPLERIGEEAGFALDRVKEPEPLGFSAFSKQGEFTNPLDTRSHIVSKTNRDPLNVPEELNKFYEKTTDNIQRMNQFDKYIEQQTGKKLRPSDRSYMLAQNSRGSDMISRTILTEQLVDSQGNVLGKSLKDITKKIPRRNVVDFEDYLIARHAQTRMARGEKVYSKKSQMDEAKLQSKLIAYEQSNPEFAQVANELYDFNNKLGEAWLVDTGIISPETWAAWREANPFWIPNKRFFTDLEKSRFTGSKKGFSGQSSPVKGYSEGGSERKIISPLESMIEYTDQFVKTAKRNEVMQSIIRQVQRHPEELDGFAEIVKSNKPSDMLKELMSEDGLADVLSKFNDDFDKAIQRTDLTKGNIVRGLVDGQPVHLKVNDPAFLEALTSLTPQGRSQVIEAARKVTSMFKVLTTGINPIFSLTRNIFYDIPQAYIFSKTTHNPLRFAVDLIDGVVSTLGNGDLYRKYKSLGGGHSSSVAADRNLLAQSKRDILPQRGGTSVFKKGYQALENLSNVIESAPRLGEFKRITKAGGDTYDSRIKGLFEAQDVTVNFKRHGDLTREADAIFPYMNAAVQGLDKFARAFKDQPVATAVKAFASITIPTLALYALNYNNPNYQKLSNYTKDRFFLFPTVKGEFIKIPKPRELGVPFGAAIERTLRAWNEEDPESFKDFANTLSIVFAPPGIGTTLEDLAQRKIPNPLRDTIAGPLIDVATNENFAGAPIVPGYLEGYSPRHQYDQNTSGIAKFVGDKLNVSPKQLDHLGRSYLGFIAELGIPATSEGASLSDTLRRQMTVDPTFSTDASRNFYDLKDRLDTQYKDAQLTDADYDNADRRFINEASKHISDIRKTIRDVDASDMSREEKKRYKKELTDIMNEIARAAYTNVMYGPE